MAGGDKTKTKKYRSGRPSYSTTSKGRTKASRRAAKAPADPKTPSPQPKQSQKRPRSISPVATPPSSAKKRTTEAPIDKSLELAGTIIRTCIKDHWWRVTPDPCAKDDICVGSQQEWSNVLPVLIEAGLLDTKRIDGTSFDLMYNTDKWKEMRDDLDRNHGIVMHLSPFRPRGKKKSHYFCLQLKKKQSKDDKMASKMANTPNFSGPAAQKAWEKKNRRSEHISEQIGRRSGGQLGRKLKEYRKQVQSDFSTAAWNDMVDAVQKLGGKLSSDLLKVVKESSGLTTSDAASAAAAASSTSDDADEAIEADDDANSSTNQYDDQVKAALDLNFDIRMANDNTLRPPRPNAQVKEPVRIRKQKQANERMRFSAVALAEIWGYSDPTRPYDDRQQIANAACRQVAYDQGFPKSTGGSQLHKWRSKLLDGVVDGKVDPIGREKVRGRVAYTEKIEEAHPGYLHELYRYATLTKGAMATFQELADCMNSKSATADETRMSITLHSFQLHRWWKRNGGKEKSSIEKPKLTKEHCKQRLEWIEKWAKITTDPNMPVAYLDEKWFYTTSRRRKIKLLPLSSHEEENTANLIALRAAENSPKMRSRRYPVKVMCLGVVARPRPDKAFNGRIMLKRVANAKRVEAKTRNELFSTDVKINYAIRYGDERGHKDWYDLHADGMTAGDLCDSIAQFYELSEFVSDRLEFHFPDYKENGEAKTGQSKHRIVKGDEVLSSLVRFTPESQGQKVKVELEDLRLAVRYKEGDTVTRDVNCDSKWMLNAMEEVATAIREAYSWVPATDTIYLVMDNAGGHGTKDAVDQHTKQLRDKHKIEIIQQVPRSPETNVLDLGIWMSLQSAVEKEHHGRRCDADALDETVMKVWGDVASEDAFKNVFGKLPTIYANIKNCNGGNDTVESNRGKVGAAKVAAEEADRNAEGVEGEPLWTLDAFEDDDMEGDDVDEVEDDEGVINLL